MSLLTHNGVSSASHMRPKTSGHDGFTLIELLVVIAIIGIIAAIAIPGLLRARMAGNETSAIGSLRAINSGQHAFAATCGHGFFASTLVELGTPAVPGDPTFISPDLGVGVTVAKSGYDVTLTGTPVGGNAPIPCNGAVLVGSYYATATPLNPGITGVRFFWTNASAGLYMQFAAFASTNESGPPAGDPAATALQ